MNSKIDLSIIIVNYNTKEFLRNCLESVFRKVRGVSFEVWVVDNASIDDSLKMVKDYFPGVKVIVNKKDIGFVNANNQAMKRVKGEYILLFNPDTIILDKNFKELIKFMEEHQEAGACGPLVLNSDGTMQRQCKRGWPTFWNSFSYYTGLWKLFPKSKWWRKKFGGYFLLDKPNDKICEVDQISGSAMIVRKKILEKVGSMSEDYLMYWDDTDWCFRIKMAGWNIYYVPLVKIIHYGGAGGTQSQPFKNLWYFHRGGCLFYSRYLAKDYPFFVNFLYYTGIWVTFLLKLLLNIFRKEKIIGSSKPKQKSNFKKDFK